MLTYSNLSTTTEYREIKDDIAFTISDDLGEFNEELETIFIKINKRQIGNDRNDILGLVCRIPGTSAVNFND